MKNRRLKWIATLPLTALLALTPGWAGAYRAVNRHEVFPVSQGVFEVVGRPGSGAADYWCGAASYARHKLATAAAQRIYIWRAIGPSVHVPGKKAVQFSLSPPANASASPGYSLSVKAVGDSLSSAAAMQYCYDRIEFTPEHDERQEKLQNVQLLPAGAKDAATPKTDTV